MEGSDLPLAVLSEVAERRSMQISSDLARLPRSLSLRSQILYPSSVSKVSAENITTEQIPESDVKGAKLEWEFAFRVGMVPFPACRKGPVGESQLSYSAGFTRFWLIA